MRIKEVANRLGTTTRTIRFYEEKGLVKPEKGANDYRNYKEEDVKELKGILALREVGMSTVQIKKFLKGEVDQFSFLDMQRSVLYEEMIQIRDMIGVLDKMMEGDLTGSEDTMELAQKLKEIKQMRKNWKDRWDFDAQAEQYDENIKTTGYGFNVHQQYEEALTRVRDCINPLRHELGLDIGVGTGNLAELFLDRGTQMIGVDQSERMLRVCLNKHPNIDARRGHFLSLPVSDKGVDFVVSSYALHHLTDEEKELALAEMDRVLINGGRLAIADLMFENQATKKSILQQYLDEGNDEAIDAINDEYYADRSRLVSWLIDRDYRVETHQFNRILHLVFASK
ncbi:putative AdoMet-dependent methyltransferase [Halobacillus dabanensis]|uniref:Putative AdoMet-dependent methyltransferase n=1 Tax=Halobacillus dabanensis TaxID=240302 RepID=A0A1I3TYB8_HALDA|nr:MerR family transcriptional regulator [Halobacillus dabanensis]SFJ75632.1 putative AdoMet-dependent methyltransferase [Halobacillus dabanensis]